MRNTRPFKSDLLIADNVLAKVLLHKLVVSLVHAVSGESLTLFDACVHLLFKRSEHSLTVKSALVGLHKTVKDIKLFLIGLALGKLAVSEKKLINGRSNLGNEDAVARVVCLVVLGGEPGVHRVSCLVSEGGNIVIVAVVVKKNVRLAVGTACAERAAALASGGVNVYPTLFGKTLFKSVVILVAVYLYGFKHVVYSLLVAVLARKRANKGSVNVVEVKLVKSENLALEGVIIVKRLKPRLNGLYKIVIDFGSYLVLEGGCGERVLVVARLCKSSFLSDAAVKHGCKGVCKLTVGAIHFLKCSHTNAAIGGTEVDAVGSIGKLNALALLVSDLAKSHIRVCEYASDIVVRAEAIAKRRNQLFALVGESVRLFTQSLFDHTAEAFKLGKLGEPSVNGLLVKTENIGGNEPGRAVCTYGKASDLTRESLVGVVCGVGGKVEVRVAPQLFDHTADCRHIGERVKEVLCGRYHSTLVLFKVRDHSLGTLEVGVERVNIFVNYRQIPFVFRVYVFSFKGHFYILLLVFFVVAVMLVRMRVVRTAELGRVLCSRALLFLGLDVACLGERDLGKHRTKQLVNKHGEEGYVSDDGRDIRKIACEDSLGFHSHAKCNAGLGKKGYAEVFYDIVVTLHSLGGGVCAEVLTNGARDDIHNADKDYPTVFEHRKLKLCTAQNKEKN